MRSCVSCFFAIVLAVAGAAGQQKDETFGCPPADHRCQLNAAMKALGANPRVPENYYNVAMVRQRAGFHKEAVDAFAMVIAIPNAKQKLVADSHNARGFSLRALKKPELALGDFDRAIALNGADPIYHYNRGYAMMDLKRMPEAIAALDRSIALDPKFAFAYEVRAGLHLSMQNLDAAIADAGRVLALLPDRISAVLIRGTGHFGKEDHAKAIADLDRYIASPKAMPGRLKDAVFIRGLSQLNLNSHQKAVDDFSRILSAYGADKQALEMRAIAYRKLNKIALAEADEKSAATLK